MEWILLVVSTIVIVSAVFVLKVRKYFLQKKEITDRIGIFDSVLSQYRKKYIDRGQYEYLKQLFQPLRDRTDDPGLSWRVRSLDITVRFQRYFDELESFVEVWNQSFIEKESEEKAPFFAKIDGKFLDEQQRAAAVTDEINTLVIAGAGSGKTLTIIGKVLYLTRVLHVEPEKILLLAYNRKAAQELTERLNQAGVPAEAQTFHRFGLSVLTAAAGRRPEVAEETLLSDIIVDSFENMKDSEKKWLTDVLDFFGLYLNLIPDESEYETLGEYYEAIRGMDLETLRSKFEKSAGRSHWSMNGEKMRSIEETLIANFLFLHGIEYEYEKRYPFYDNPKKTYHPDFYLPEYDIYWEHFGIDENGNLPWLSPKEERKYKNEMEWKRKIHRENNTVLIESYSCWKRQGQFISKIDHMLRENGVRYRQIDAEAVFHTIYRHLQRYSVTSFISLMSSFIRLLKENSSLTFDELYRREKNGGSTRNNPRKQLFLDIIKTVYEKYEKTVRDKNQADFSDMIKEAADIIRRGGRLNAYRYIIVDEFQDISRGRCEMLRSIVRRTGAKLFCVGDDWQSIYRFSGSDVKYIVNFSDYFGYTRMLRIEKTYRFSQQLVAVTEPFILKNPQQIRKRMKSDKSTPYPVIVVRYTGMKVRALNHAVEKIAEEYGTAGSIGLLMRNGYDADFLEKSDNWKPGRDISGSSNYYIYRKIPSLKIQALTVHSAKGLEADNIIILNAVNGMTGFPNKMADDPLLRMVLPDADSFRYAEERRLFYVAMTRTKNKVYILAPEHGASEFVGELKESEQVAEIFVGKKTPAGKNLICPVCRKGHLTVRKNSRGESFLGCSLYPNCSYTGDIRILTSCLETRDKKS